MRVLVSGGSGLIGSALREALERAGQEVVRLRHAPGVAAEDLAGQARPGEVLWNWEAGAIDATALRDFDAVVHLAGENVAGRWTARRKARIRDSRVIGTRMLADTLSRLDGKPGVLVTASGINYYGNRGAEELDESSPPGGGFLADVCRDWEGATEPAARAGIRVVHTRFGMVLSSRGGALGKMLPLFRKGLGGKLGSGRQYVSWVSLRDAVRTIRFLFEHEDISGPVNVTAPQPVTNRDLTDSLARVLKRPAFLPAPAFALRLTLGQMADEMLLASMRVLPRRLRDAGFVFKDAFIDKALTRAIKREKPVQADG